MFHVKYLFYIIFSHLIVAKLQLNLYYTDWISQNEDENDNVLQHNCFRIDIGLEEHSYLVETIYYCMSESPSKFNIDNNAVFPKFTFDQLSKQNITSQQLYLWSAPIDIVEDYQFYLNQLSTSNDLFLTTKFFYNCTLPRFGPMCQYELYYHSPHHSSLLSIVDDFYSKYKYISTNLTCYVHLKCNRGPNPSCLDWSEICDGKVDCLDGAFDEEHCWQIEINKCKDNEYRCMNGQCIPQSFFRDDILEPDCVDSSDVKPKDSIRYVCDRNRASIGCDDRICNETHLTSSCMTDRRNLLLKAMYSIKDNSVSDDCWSALKCLFNVPDSEYSFCRNLCANNVCIEIVQNNCSDMFYFPNVPVFFGHIYFVFRKGKSQYVTIEDLGLLYICYNNSRYDPFFNMTSKVLFNNTMCFVHETISYPSNWSDLWSARPDTSLHKLYNDLKKYQLIFNYTSTICNRSNMHQCANSSKCISIHRLMDNIYDCPYMDDENSFEINNNDVLEELKHTHFKCKASNKYIHQSLTENGYCDCEEIQFDCCEDEREKSCDTQKNISFQMICDGFIELTPIIINEQNETDETECEQWECNNIYTSCNRVWNCPNGVDEVSCPSSPPFNCSSNHRICVSPHTNQFTCLFIEKVYDGKIDCLGATDEMTLCRSKTSDVSYGNNFRCMNQTSQLCVHYSNLCDGYKNCEHGDDEQFCTTNANYGICSLDGLSHVEKFLCDYTKWSQKQSIMFFLPSRTNVLIGDVAKNIENTIFSSDSLIQMSDQYQPRCHRGLDLRVWLNNKKNLTENTCLCPPSFYGSQCQYQNQRISLTIKYKVLSDSSQTLFTIVISLIDDSDQRIIHSYEQFTYLSMRDCQTKFNFYLVYSTRPKDSTKHYSIHIDIYEKVKLTYRGSLLFPIKFPFLPVHRLALIVDIPRSDDKNRICLSDKCVHGKCIKYSNNPENVSFCQCDQGWSGRYCTIRHISICSSDSLCIGVSANNRSVCVCPMNKFGTRCLLTNTICQNDNNSTTCKNGGQCVSNDDYMVSDQTFECICAKGFSGKLCDIVDNRIILSFDKDIVLPQLMFIHFIEVVRLNVPVLVRSTIFQTISVNQDSVTIYWSVPFHLVFVELSYKSYYLTVVQETYNQSTTMEKKMKPSDRCPHISELFNETFVQWHLIRRIKYYHLPCQKQPLNLSCFHDDVQFCLCYNFGQKRLANCFDFDHNMTFDCLGQNECEKGAQCFQYVSDIAPYCPIRSMCMCPPCVYGRLCQFSTSGFGLSLDAILGYHILPDVSLTHQSFIVKFSLALTIIFIVVGLIDGLCSLITFKNKIVREVGCGLYLLGSSITTLLTIMMFALKFLILLLAQMTIISNRSFLSVQCHSMDFILRVCLCIDQWLNACVAIERAITAIKGISFVKKKSKQAAKLVIIILFIVVVGTCIHDPIYRRLIDERNDDENVKRIWCIVTYPSNLEIYNSIIHIFHFFGPFLINLISAVVLITTMSRQQANLHKQRPYKEHLREQCQQHKHLLTASVVLVILAVPRLIITFVSRCMQSVNDSWLFLIGYFISFIPSMLTFIIFILPSKFYRKEFHKSLDYYRTQIRRCLHLIS